MSALTSSHLLSVFGFSENDIFVGGAEGTMLHYDGSQWTPMETGGRWTFKDIWGSAPDNVFAVVTDGRILHYDGKAWAPDEDMEKLPPMNGIFGLSRMKFMPVPDWGKSFAMMALPGNIPKREPIPM